MLTSGLFFGARLLHAQVPLAAVDLLVGAGVHSSAGGVYNDAPVATLRLTTSIRLGTSDNTRPVLRVELEPRRAITGSDGTSGPYPFPPIGGISVGLGVSHMANPGLALVAAVGGGSYGGTYRGTRHNSIFGEADVAQQVVGHMSFTANMQYRQWAADGVRFWYTPLTVGIRLF